MLFGYHFYPLGPASLSNPLMTPLHCSHTVRVTPAACTHTACSSSSSPTRPDMCFSTRMLPETSSSCSSCSSRISCQEGERETPEKSGGSILSDQIHKGAKIHHNDVPSLRLNWALAFSKQLSCSNSKICAVLLMVLRIPTGKGPRFLCTSTNEIMSKPAMNPQL